MDTHQVLQITWFLIIGFLLTGYTILDGFDLGIGVSLPLLCESEGDTKKLFTAIGPLWDGNEVWLITGGAALFAAFPQAYATVFSGFYLALMLLLFALIFRAVSIEFWFLDEKRRKLWMWTYSVCSALVAFLLSVTLGNIVFGVPLDYQMNYIGSFFTLLRPFPLLIGLLGLTLIILHGCSFAILKTSGQTNSRAKSVAATVWMFHVIIAVASVAAAALVLPESMTSPWSWALFAVAAASITSFRLLLHGERDGVLYMTTAGAIVSFWGIAGLQLYPNLVRASEGFDITIFSASSSELTLKVMLIITCIGIPIVLGYTVYVYRVFKGKIVD